MFNLILQMALHNVMFIGLHLENRNMFPKQLSKADEAECIQQMASGDVSARNKLIEHNLRLISYIVKKNYPEASDPDELISIGTIGLIKAVDTYDYQKGKQFSTYASKCIDNQIKMHYRKIKHQLTEVYIDEPLDTDSEGNTLTLADIYSSDVNIEDETLLKINSEKLYKFIEEELDEREHEIISRRYGIPDKNGRICKPLTQREIADTLGISRSYISRIEKRALEKLRARFDL